MSVVSPNQAARQPEPGDGQGANLTIIEHLQEARKRLMICAAALGVGLLIGAWRAEAVMRWMVKPAENVVEDFELIFVTYGASMNKAQLRGALGWDAGVK